MQIEPHSAPDSYKYHMNTCTRSFRFPSYFPGNPDNTRKFNTNFSRYLTRVDTSTSDSSKLLDMIWALETSLMAAIHWQGLLFLLTLHATVVTSVWPPQRGVRYDGYIISNGAERRYKLYAPGPDGDGYEDYCGSMRQFPLIFAFHGRGGDAKRMTDISKLNQKSVCAFVVVPFGMYGPGPNSDPKIKHCWEPAKYAGPIDLDTAFPPDPPRYRDDKLFVRDIMDVLWKEYGNGILWDRVYLTGKSSGAGFVNHLVCTMPERFAAIAPVAGPFVNPGSDEDRFVKEINKDCKFIRAMPVINFHGTSDLEVPYDGDPEREGSWLPAVQDWAKWWADKNKCSSYSKTTPDPPDRWGQSVIVHHWLKCTDGIEVRHYEITKGVHDWPSMSSTADTNDDESVGTTGRAFREYPIEATPEILPFLNTYRIPSKWFRDITITAHLDIHDEENWPWSDENGSFDWAPSDPVCLNPFTMKRELQWEKGFGGEIRSVFTLTLTFDPESVSVQVDWNLKLYEGTTEDTDDLDGQQSGSFTLKEDEETVAPVRVLVTNTEEDDDDHLDLTFTVKNGAKGGDLRC